MTNNVIVRKWKNTGLVKVDNLSGITFTGESGAHTFRIQGIDADGQKQPITGAISGKFWNKNTNITTPLSGTIEDGEAVVTLDAPCYVYGGLFSLMLFATNGSTVSCIYCGVGKADVSQSDTIAYPTAAIPDIVNLVNELQTILDNWPEDYSQLQSDVSSLKSAVGANLVGTSIGKLYPVHIVSGSKLTVSTSDSSTFDQTVKLHYWGLDKSHTGQWAFGSSYGNSRTVTAGADIYWLSFEWQDASTFGVETGETMPTPYMVNRGTSAETYKAWFENPDVRALSLAVDTQISGIESDISGIETDITNLQNRDTALDAKIDNVSANYNQYRNDKESGFISLNANYFNADTAKWNDGLVATATGSITQTTEYEYAFCPLQGEGTYITQINGSQYGTNARKMALYDAGKQFIKSIDADSYNGNNQKYTLSSADAKTAVYTILQRKKNSSTIPKLFFNPIWNDPSTFPTDSSIALPPVYGHVSDKLYKKVFICDGDSICDGDLDNPYQWSGWYGRILRGYQTSGNNYAVGGGTIMDRTDETVGGQPRHCIALTIDTIYSQYPSLDYLILEGGTNDADLTGAFDGDTPPERFGTWDKESYSADYVNALDVTTFCGAVEYLFYKAITYFPNTKIGFIIPMKMGLYTYQKTVRKRYFDEIVEIAKKWGIPVLNLWDNMHVVPNFDAYYDRTKTEAQNVAAGKFYNDGQHPTSYGYNLMQNTIEAWIKSL